MAQLKDSLITGSLRVTDTIYTTNETISSLTASAAVVSDANKNLISRTILNNTSAAAVTGSDSLITANTLVNAGYVKSSGVTSITLTSGAGITVSDSGTAITSTGSRTISITGVDTSSGSETQCLTKKGTWKTFGTSNLTIGTTNSTAMAGNTVVNKVKTTAKTDDVNYKILLNGAGASPTSGSDYEAVYSTNATFNTSSMLITTTKNNHTGDQGLVLDNTETNKVLKLGYIIGSSGNGGIYDYTHSEWKVKIATDGTTIFTGNSTGVSYQHASLDFSQTNNALSSDWAKSMCWFGDKNGSGIGRVYFVAKTDGTNQISLQARRWNTSGNAIGSFAGISIVGNRSNAITCTIDGITTVSGSITSIGNNFIKHSTIDITSASNNLSSNTGVGFYGIDKNGKDYTRCMSYALTSGETRLYLQVRNHTGSAYTSYGGIIMKANTSDSNISYEVTSAGNFRSAISAFYTGGGTLTGTLIINKTNAMALQIKPYGGTYGTSGEASIWYCGTDATASGYVANTLYIGGTGNQNLKAAKVYGAVWNDYAEFRKTNDKAKPGNVVIDNDDGSLTLSYARLLPGAQVVSDTYGFAIGQAEKTETPLAVSGRVLVYTYQNRNKYHAGQAVCSAPNGTVDIMTRHEISEYPDAIIGIVSEIPEYEEWGTGKVKVDGRIWIKVR